MHFERLKRYTIGQIIILAWYYFWGHILGALFTKGCITMENTSRDMEKDSLHLDGNGSVLMYLDGSSIPVFPGHAHRRSGS